jgi:hypothetical protein
MRMQFASVHPAVLTHMFSYNLPRGFEFVRAVSTGVKGHFGAVDGAVDGISAARGET